MERTKLRLHRKACRQLGINPDKVKLVGPTEYKQITGCATGNVLGRTTGGKGGGCYYVKRDSPLWVYLHELLHILFPKKPHWWIFCASWKIYGLKPSLGRGYRYGYGGGMFVSTVRMHDLPSKHKLLELCHKQAIKRELI